MFKHIGIHLDTDANAAEIHMCIQKCQVAAPSVILIRINW
jgi:hypothetical protein